MSPRPAAAPSRPGRRPRPRGFTLLEILLTLALIGLFGGFLVAGSSRLLTTRGTTPTEVFWQAVREARRAALQGEREIRLKFDREGAQFYLVDGDAPAEPGTPETVERARRRFPVAKEAAEGLEVDFLGSAAQGGNAILVGGLLLEARTLPHVTFHADGTCSPFRAQIARAGGRSVLRIDPWTCAPVLDPADARPDALP